MGAPFLNSSWGVWAWHSAMLRGDEKIVIVKCARGQCDALTSVKFMSRRRRKWSLLVAEFFKSFCRSFKPQRQLRNLQIEPKILNFQKFFKFQTRVQNTKKAEVFYKFQEDTWKALSVLSKFSFLFADLKRSSCRIIPLWRIFFVVKWTLPRNHNYNEIKRIWNFENF